MHPEKPFLSKSLTDLFRPATTHSGFLERKVSAMNTLQLPKFAYLDGIDWQHHVESDAFGIKIYPSVRALKTNSGHSMKECGIVKIELREVEWVMPQNLHIAEPKS